MNMHVQVFVWIYVFIFLGFVPRIGIVGSYGNSMLNLFRNCQTVFHSGCIILYSHRYIRAPISPHPCQHLLLSVFYYSHPIPVGYYVTGMN